VDLHRYRFRSVWPVAASPEDSYRALREIEDYPTWWPEVRSVTCVAEATYDVVCRSALPYDLAFRTVRSREDSKGRVLEAQMSGDLDGFSRWTVVAAPFGSSLVFEEHVEARKALLRRLGVVARPAFVANHAVMMRHGQAGLRPYLAGLRRGLDPL
jgi:hypothetical protein